MFGHVLIPPTPPAVITELVQQLLAAQLAAELGTMTSTGLPQIGQTVLNVMATPASQAAIPDWQDKWSTVIDLNAAFNAGNITLNQYIAAMQRVLQAPQRVCSVSELRKYLRLPANNGGVAAAAFEDEEALLGGLIDSSTTWLQDLTGRQFLTATWQLTLSSFPGVWTSWAPPNVPIPQVQGVPIGWPVGSQYPETMEIELPFAPLQAVTEIQYTDTTGTPQTLPSDQYQVDNTTMIGRVAPSYGNVWPVAQLQYKSVVITYTCGYGVKTQVPADLVRAVKTLAGLAYSQREAAVQLKLSDVPYSLQSVFQKYKVRRAV